jgi:hypothetical protein
MCYRLKRPRHSSCGFFLILVCEAIGAAATPGLLCQPRVIVKMIVEKQMECRLARETEVLEENLPQRHFVHHKSHMTRPGFVNSKHHIAWRYTTQEYS